MSRTEPNRTTHREVELLQALRQLGGSARNAELAERLDVSEETVRRAGKALERARLVKRVHGGVFLPEAAGGNSVFDRSGRRSKAKTRIAELAAGLIPDGACVFLDSSSTAAFVAHALTAHRGLTVVSNSLNSPQGLSNRNGNRVFLAGGELLVSEQGTFGQMTTDFIGQFRFDCAILGVDGLDAEKGFLLSSAGETATARAAIAAAHRTMIVADARKFGQRAEMVICEPARVAVLVTDQPLAPAFRDACAAWEVEAICAADAR